MRSDEQNEDDLSQLKFEGPLLSLRALDPNFSQTKNILSTWLDENSISSRKIDFFWKKMNPVKSEETSVAASSDKGKEEEDDFSPTFKI